MEVTTALTVLAVTKVAYSRHRPVAIEHNSVDVRHVEIGARALPTVCLLGHARSVPDRTVTCRADIVQDRVTLVMTEDGDALRTWCPVPQERERAVASLNGQCRVGLGSPPPGSSRRASPLPTPGMQL